ncbi:MAG: LPD38 domain-containing protein [Clostridia bacterium]|jgi:hypothetical protein
MAFFKLSDLSEKEKKKYLQSIEDQVNERLNSRNSLEKEANDNFNNIFNSKYGQNNNINVGNTNDWATSKIKEKNSADNLLAPVETKINEDLYKNDLKNSAQQYYDNSNISYKNKNIFEDILGIGENLVRGASSGLKQTMNYATAVNKGYKGYNDITNKLARAKYLSTPIQDRKEEDLNKNFIEEAVNNSIQKDNEAVSKNINSMSGKVTQKLSELAPSIGQMGVGAVLSSVNPALGTGYFYSSAAGGYLDDAKSRGMNEKQALVYSSVLGGLEAATEEVGIRNFEKAGAGVKALLSGAGKEGAKTAVENIAKKEIATSVKDVLKNYGIGIADNFIQEAIMDPLQEISATAVAGKEKADWSGMGQKMLQDGINGGLVAAIVGGANLGINSCTGIVDKNNNGQNVSQTEYKQALQDAQGAGIDIQQNIKDKINEQINNLNNQEGKANTENILNRESVQDIANNSQLQQNNNTNKTVVKDFNESAKRYNIDYNNEDLKEINQMYNKRGITTYFDENTFKNNKDVFSIWKPTYDENGNISGREVVFNPNSQDTKTRVQELAIHELGHDLELNEVQNMILKDASRKENWKNARKSLEDTYKQAYENDGIQISKEDFNKIVDEEATMSILQRELGSQEYVNRLVNQNQSIAKKIYNWVIDKLNKFTGGKNEKIFWTDIRNKFETAYNQEFNKNDSDLKYSIAGKEALKNIKDQQVSKEAYNSYNKAKQMAKNKESNEKIFKETGWYKDKVTGKMKFNFSDKNMKIVDKNYKVGQEFKLKDILVHDTLFEMYPQLKDYKVKIEDMNSNKSKSNSKLNGRYNRLTNELTIDINRFNNISNAEGTLIHEIQHAIQQIEGFAGGTSTKFGKEKYKNNPGEIEARDTSARMIQEKYKQKDLINSMPKSANADTTILEKMKIGLYNYLSNISNEEISNEFNESNKKKNSSNTSENNGLVLGGIKENNVESENNSGSFSLLENKQKQLNIIQENNKMQDDYHTGIRNIEDIKTFEEAIHDNESFVYGDYSFEDAQKDLERGKVTVYSSKPITQGGFVSTSKNMAQDYAGNGKIYSKEVSINDVAWINGDEGQYANINQKYAVPTKNWQQFVENNYQQQGTGKNLKEYKLAIEKVQENNRKAINNSSNTKNYVENSLNIPTREYFEDKKMQDLLTDEDYKVLNDIYEKEGKTDISTKQEKGNYLEKYEGDTESNDDFSNTKRYIENNLNVPTKEYFENKKSQELLTDEDYAILNDIYEKEGRTEILTSKKKDNILGKYENNTASIDDFSNTKKYIENNLNVPTKEFFENKIKQDLLTDEDYAVLNDIYEKEGETKILTEKKKANILEKYVNDKYKFKDSFDELAQKFINKGHYIDKLSKEANNPELKYAYDRNLNSFAEGQYEVGVAQTNNEGKKIGKSINEIWEPIEKQNLTKEFSEYLLHKHNIDRSERNKFVFGSEIGPAESTAIAMELEQRYPKFKEYAKDIKKFNHNNLQCLVDAGLLSNDMVKYLESMYPNYVTISRDLQDSTYAGDKNKTGVNAPIKNATGGNADIQPLKETMAQQAIKIKRLINQNMLGQELAKTLKNSHVEQEGSIQLSPTMLFGLDTLIDTDTKGNKYYTYFENGELQKLKIDDNLYESLKPTERSRLEETLPVKALQKVTSLHRSVLTSSNPIFIVTNFFKDFQDGMFNSKYSSKFVKNYGKALNEIMTKGEYYETYMANGGMTNTYFDYNEGIKKQPNKFVEKIRNANEIVEQLPRMSEFISTLEDGKSLNEALYNAAEITTNFKRGGDITKAINRNGVNFLNASIQGLDKQFRNFSEQKGAKGYVNLLVKATLMGVVPSILNHILLDDDKDYEKLPESTKDLYYLFKTGEGKFIRIPKGRVLSVFGAAARRTLESIEGNEDAWKGFKDTVINQVAPNNPLEDNILAPIMQVKNNKTWYGSDLVSSRLQKELPKNQYDETTDEFSKWLGSKINASPKKINYLIDQYSGGVGDVLLPMITPQAKQNVFKDKFTTDSVLKNKYVSKFYETLEKQNQIANDPLATDEDEIQLKYLNNTSKEMGKLYKEKRNVQMSNISNKEKTAKVREIQEKINELAESSLQNYTNFTKTQNSAKIGDQEYYKNGSGEWTSMNEETKQKNSNISTETYSDYKQKVYQETQKQRANGNLNKNQSLKQKDKIQILLNSKYSDKEKKALYSTYIKNEQDTEYEIMNYANTDIDEYLKYKQQGFDSDYVDNGTVNGKAISGSKQRKVYEYINSAKMTYEQKLLLLGMQYKLTSGERSTLAKYVDTLNITSDEKLKAYKKIKGFTVYKNGKVSW